MDITKICPICVNDAPPRLVRSGVQYWQCSNCKTIFCDELDNSDKVGGGFEVERNTQQNHLRIDRIDEMCLGCKKEEVSILDFGCGTGYLVEDLKKHGYVNTFGYDAYNEKFKKLPERDKFHIVVSVEVFEHLSHPYIEIDVIHRSLKLGGVCYVETGFLNAAWEDGVADEDNFYINPDAGHSTIYTHHSIDLLMARKGFDPVQKFNRHVHLYKKK